MVTHNIQNKRELLSNSFQGESLSVAVQRHLSHYFAAHEGALPSSGLYKRVLKEIERPLLSLTLEATGGNQLRAATLLGLNRNTLRKKMKDLGLPTTRDARRDIELRK